MTARRRRLARAFARARGAASSKRASATSCNGPRGARCVQRRPNRATFRDIREFVRKAPVDAPPGGATGLHRPCEPSSPTARVPSRDPRALASPLSRAPRLQLLRRAWRARVRRAARARGRSRVPLPKLWSRPRLLELANPLSRETSSWPMSWPAWGQFVDCSFVRDCARDSWLVGSSDRRARFGAHVWARGGSSFFERLRRAQHCRRAGRHDLRCCAGLSHVDVAQHERWGVLPTRGG